MPFARTVLGDIAPEELGIVYAHEHLVIHGGRAVQLFPDFELADVDKAVAELAPVQAMGLRTVVDAMPADLGRDVLMLAEIARRSGVNVIAPSGLHHERYYHDRHWSVRLSADEIADLFVADISDGIDELDYCGPIVKRTPHRAGVMKIAGSTDGPSKRDEKVFAAAAMAQHRTGCPILTHCEGGTGALEQVEILVKHGGDPAHIVLSHVDKIVDRAVHAGHRRDRCQGGVRPGLPLGRQGERHPAAARVGRAGRLAGPHHAGARRGAPEATGRSSVARPAGPTCWGSSATACVSAVWATLSNTPSSSTRPVAPTPSELPHDPA